jgi:CRP-like cAMP-binding protein
MQKFIQLLAKNVTEKEQQLLGIAYNSLRKKVADALVTLHSKYKTGDKEFLIDMTRENLATIAGTAKESLIRTLSDFKEEKLIDIRGGDIAILDEKRLKNLLN